MSMHLARKLIRQRAEERDGVLGTGPVGPVGTR